MSKQKPLIKLKNDCRVHVEKYQIIQDVGKQVRDTPNLSMIKNDIEMLKWIISLIHNSIHPKVKDKLKPGDIAYELFMDIFPSLSVEEKELIRKNINYIVNNKHIEKISFFKRNSKRFRNFFFKK